MKLFNWLFYSGFDKKVYEKLKDKIAQTNRDRLKVFSICFSIGCLLMAIYSFISTSVDNIRPVYFSCSVAMLLIFNLSIISSKENDKIIMVLTHCFIGVLLVFGIVIGTIFSPKEISATYIALMLTAPQVFIDKTYRMHLTTLVINIAFIVMVIFFKDPSTWSSDIINAVIFHIATTILITYNNNVRISRLVMEERISELASTDQLTGLLNRYSYELALVQAEKEVRDSIYCVYIDVNGLHELNNSMGHSAGDVMLKFISSTAQNIFGVDSTFRIGGDEFVALGFDMNEEEITNRINELKCKVDNEGYHVAVGYQIAKQKGINSHKLVKEAEAMMYVDKKAYYESTGKNPQRIH